MDIYELVNKYINAGYSENGAIPKVAQDIFYLKLEIANTVRILL